MSIGRILIVLGIVVAGSAAVYSLRPDIAPAVDFVDDLTGPTSSQFNIPFDKYMLTPEGLRRVQSDSGRLNGTDRPVVRTLSDLYLSRDFVFEVDITIPPDVEDLVFVGFGEGAATAPFNEPGGAFGFRIHHMPTNREVRLAAITHPPAGVGPTYPFNEMIGIVPENGAFTVRLERAGDQLIGSMPGQDGSESTLEISAYPEILGRGRGFLYLSNTAEGTVFNKVTVRPRT